MAEMDFDDAVKYAKKIEGKALSPTDYKGPIDIIRAIELTPEEYEDITYTGLVNLYERLEKIKKATRMEIYSPPSKEIKKEVSEVEERVKEISEEAKEDAEKIKEAEKKVEAPPAEKKPEPIEYGAIEFERPKAAPEFEAPEVEEPEEKPPEFEAPPVEEKPEAPPEEKIEPEIEAPVVGEKKLEAPPPLPPILTEKPDEAGEQKFTEIEEHLKQEAEMDETSIKKKMLALTKELFKEKSVSKREKIKLEITVLKNMLTRAKGKKPTKKKTAKSKKIVNPDSSALLDTIISTQTSEASRIEDSIASSYRKKREQMKDRFYADAAKIPEDEKEKRKELYEKFIFKMTSLSEQIPQETKRYSDYLTKKHVSEIERVEKSLKKTDKKIMKKAKERKKEIESKYEKEFNELNNSLQKTIEAVIEKTGHDVLKEEEETPETDVSNVVYEITETDVGTLLYYLHSKDPEYYKKYERKGVSKTDAVRKAKMLMAKEKGLSDDMIRKYFGTTEG